MFSPFILALAFARDCAFPLALLLRVSCVAVLFHFGIVALGKPLRAAQSVVGCVFEVKGRGEQERNERSPERGLRKQRFSVLGRVGHDGETGD